MMLPHWSAIIATLTIIVLRIKTIIGWCGEKWTTIKPVVGPLIEKAEELAKDGKIDRADRKVLVMLAINKLQETGTLKLNFIEKWIIEIVVDYMARRLPDFIISQKAEEVLTGIANDIQKGAVK
jgi:hypothetical protein